MRALLTAALFSLSLAACAPPDEPPPDTGGDPGGDSGGGGSGGGGSSGGGDATPTLALSFDPSGGQGASRLDLEIVGLGVFTSDPTYVNADTPCDAGVAGALLDLRANLSLDLASSAEAPFTSLDMTSGGAVRELWLVLRQGLLFRDARSYKVHAGALCVMPDGLQYILVRLRPGSAVPLDGDHRVVVELDASRDVVVERVRCGGDANYDECGTTEDVGDDGDAGTRLRYSFAPTLPVRVDPK